MSSLYRKGCLYVEKLYGWRLCVAPRNLKKYIKKYVG
jgi:hypothetical protein